MKQHKCIREANKKLEGSNTILVYNILNPNHIVVATQKLDKSFRTKALTVIASHCPFCGEKLEGV